MSALPSRPRLPGRAPSAEHQAAVARRIEQLRAELATPPGARGPALLGADPEPGPPPEADAWWSDATRVRPAPPVAGRDHREGELGAVDAGGASPAGPGPEPARPVPVPGRHAARRERAGWGEVVPPPLRGRFALGPSHVAVVAVLVALGLAVTAWGVVRADPAPVPVAASTDTTSGPSPGAGSAGASADDGAELVALEPPAGADGADGADAPAVPASAAAAVPGPTAGTVTVDVAGKVRRPGIAVLPTGARVVDAVEAAGGARDGVDLTSLNLARPLVDGEQVLVGVSAPPGPAAAAVQGATVAGDPAAGSGALVDLNTATEAELDTLPEVGPVTAAAVVAWREQHGGFSAVDELLEVDGIGEATLARVAPHVTV